MAKKKTEKLLTYKQVSAKKLRNDMLDPIESFILNYTPHNGELNFNRDLLRVIKYSRQNFEIKSNKWDKLDEKLAEFYSDEHNDPNEEDGEPGLIEIGEAAASAFGYL